MSFGPAACNRLISSKQNTSRQARRNMPPVFLAGNMICTSRLSIKMPHGIIPGIGLNDNPSNSGKAGILRTSVFHSGHDNRMPANNPVAAIMPVFAGSEMVMLKSFFDQVPFGIQCGHTTRSCCGHRLTVYLVLGIAAGENAFNIRIPGEPHRAGLARTGPR